MSMVIFQPRDHRAPFRTAGDHASRPGEPLNSAATRFDDTGSNKIILCKINGMDLEATTRIELVYTVLQTVA